MLTSIQWYALAVVAVVVLLSCSRLAHTFVTLLRCSRAYLARHLCLPRRIPHMTWLGAWTWWSFLVQTIITGANLVLIFVRAPNIKSAGQRAGEVAVVNLTLLFLGPQLSDHADLLNLSLTQMKVVHRGATWLLLVAVAIHVVILQPSQSVFTSKPSKDLYGVIVGG